MVTLQDDALLTAGPYPPDRAEILDEADTAPDSALLATLGSRLHCRTPMKRLDGGERATGGPAPLEVQGTAIRPGKGPGSPGMATYRCRCGFTMDAPSTGPDRAAAN